MRTSKFNQKIPSRPEGINKMQTNFSRSGRYSVLVKLSNLQKEKLQSPISIVTLKNQRKIQQTPQKLKISSENSCNNLKGTYVCISGGKEMLTFWTILRAYLMDDLRSCYALKSFTGPSQFMKLK